MIFRKKDSTAPEKACKRQSVKLRPRMILNLKDIMLRNQGKHNFVNIETFVQDNNFTILAPFESLFDLPQVMVAYFSSETEYKSLQNLRNYKK